MELCHAFSPLINPYPSELIDLYKQLRNELQWVLFMTWPPHISQLLFIFALSCLHNYFSLVLNIINFYKMTVISITYFVLAKSSRIGVHNLKQTFVYIWLYFCCLQFFYCSMGDPDCRNVRRNASPCVQLYATLVALENMWSSYNV